MRSTKGAEVLVVEDEPLVAALLETVLNEMGYATLPLPSSPFEAESFLQNENPPLCMILDINLWGRDSYHLARIAIDRGIPVALISGYTANQVNKEFAHLPYLSKPFTNEEVANILSRLLTSPSG